MIAFEGVTKRFPRPDGGERAALADLSLEVAPGETLCLIGGSGSGKTTVLRLINRLTEPSTGMVRVNGRDVADVDPLELRRGIGYVIQSGGLFPHLTVAGNLELLPELVGWSAAKRRERANELLERVRLKPAEFAQRYPNELSGGQQQRVGVARALALDPPIVLLDEPFGALDPITRRELQREFRDLAADGSRTFVFVTHDLAEAFALGDRVALLDGGRLQQVGTPAELREQPANDHVARFVREQEGL